MGETLSKINQRGRAFSLRRDKNRCAITNMMKVNLVQKARRPPNRNADAELPWSLQGFDLNRHSEATVQRLSAHQNMPSSAYYVPIRRAHGPRTKTCRMIWGIYLCGQVRLQTTNLQLPWGAPLRSSVVAHPRL